MRGVILAGGTGTRLSPLTEVTNKHLLPVYDEPMIFKPIATLRGSGITEIAVVLGGNGVGDFIRLLRDGSRLGVRLTYVYQEGAGGIAEALLLARHFACGGSVAVILGDNIFEDTFRKEVEAFEEDTAHDCYLFIKDVKRPERFGVAELGPDGEILGIEEKPAVPKSPWAVAGFYIYRGDVFDRIEQVRRTIGYSARGELEITDVNNGYVRDGKAKAWKIRGFWSDAGTFASLFAASRFVEGRSGRR